jgi:hypothetical protein
VCALVFVALCLWSTMTFLNPFNRRLYSSEPPPPPSPLPPSPPESTILTKRPNHAAGCHCPVRLHDLLRCGKLLCGIGFSASMQTFTATQPCSWHEEDLNYSFGRDSRSRLDVPWGFLVLINSVFLPFFYLISPAPWKCTFSCILQSGVRLHSGPAYVVHA